MPGYQKSIEIDEFLYMYRGRSLNTMVTLRKTTPHKQQHARLLYYTVLGLDYVFCSNLVIKTASLCFSLKSESIAAIIL